MADCDVGSAKQLLAEHLDVLCRYPRGAQAHVNLSGRQVLRLDSLERLDILLEPGISDTRGLGNLQLLADVAGQVLIVGLPLVRLWVEENRASQFGQEFVFGASEQ